MNMICTNTLPTARFAFLNDFAETHRNRMY